MMKLNVEKVNLKVWVDLTGEVLNSQLSDTWKAEHSAGEHFHDGNQNIYVNCELYGTCHRCDNYIMIIFITCYHIYE